MPTEKFIFKVYRNGHVERVKDCNNITFQDVINGLGVALCDIECKPINNSGIYAFYGDEKCEVLIFGIPENKPNAFFQADDAVHGLLPSQFRMLSTPETP
ncbi:MAG: hypothetical protein SVR94_00520 [Pseudomonadota bacterium]|nr:hypothetical protein [Pseudomonadota bacterium]